MLEHRILVVDDDEHVRFVLKTALDRVEGVETIVAQNVLEALTYAKAQAFDLLITDLRLPRRNGLALTSAFRKLNPDTPVIWLTAFGCYRMRSEAKTLNVHRCLNKPVDIHEIRAVTLEALGQECEAA